jgi:NAD(P)-dependent dehydrogenase (short-subunit alcohol dehydrogenase family)
VAVAESAAKSRLSLPAAAHKPLYLASAAKAIASAGLAHLTIDADLRTLEGCQKVFDSVSDKFNRCGILVCSAGATRAGNFTELPDQAWIDGYALVFWLVLESAANCFAAAASPRSASDPCRGRAPIGFQDGHKARKFKTASLPAH